MAHDWNEMVSITLPKNGDLVTVNGKTYEIERGKPTKVPYPVYERLQLMLAFDQTPPAKVPRMTWADLGESKEEGTLLPETVVNDGSGNAPVPLDLDITQINVGDKLTVVFDGVSYPVTVADMSFLEPDAIGFGNLTMFDGPGADEPFLVVGIPTVGVMMQMNTSDDADHTIAIHGVVTKYNPIPAEYLPAGGGGGIKTAIFKQACYDDYLAGNMDNYTSTMACVNMTRDEAIQTIMSGQPLEAIYMMCGDNRGFLTTREPSSNIAYNPFTDELLVGESELWNANNELESAGGDV